MIAVRRRVMGVTELNGYIYAVVNDSKRMRVFGSAPSYSRSDDIVISGLTGPWNLTVSFKTGHLFIADHTGQCVWRVELKDQKDSDNIEEVKVEKWAVIEGRP